MLLAGRAFSQEPAQEAPPPAVPPAHPDDSAFLPEDPGTMPNPDAPAMLSESLPNPPPETGVVPRRTPQNLEEWMEDEASEPAPVTEAPSREAGADLSPDLSRGVAMSQALSTGETLLGNLGGLNGSLSSPFLAGAPELPIATSGVPSLRPIRVGSFDVNMHASLGATGTHVGGPAFDDDFSESAVFEGGIQGLYGRGGLTTLWFSYDVAGNYPDNSAQGRTAGGGGGTGGFNQNVSVIGSFVFPELRKVKFVFGAKYASLSGLDRDTGVNSRRQIATALFSTTYDYSPKTSFSLDVSVPIRQFSNAVSSTGVTTTLFVDNQVTRKTSFGLGYTFGTLTVEGGADQTFHQGLLRTRYAPTRFIAFDATTGVDIREHGDSSAVTPIFGLSATWDSRSGTLLTLAAERRVFNAASAVDTNFTSTSIVVTATQRFRQAVVGSLSAGFEYTEYDSFGGGAKGGRTDKLSYVSAGVTVPLSLHWNCSLNASAGKNESNVQAFDFVQMTFKTTLAF